MYNLTGSDHPAAMLPMAPNLYQFHCLTVPFCLQRALLVIGPFIGCSLALLAPSQQHLSVPLRCQQVPTPIPLLLMGYSMDCNSRLLQHM